MKKITAYSLEECKEILGGKTQGGAFVAGSSRRITDKGFRFFLYRNPGGWRSMLQLGAYIKGTVSPLPEGGCVIQYSYGYSLSPVGGWIYGFIVLNGILPFLCLLLGITSRYSVYEQLVCLIVLTALTALWAVVSIPLTKVADKKHGYTKELDQWLMDMLHGEETR